jgi:hypothetical protein
MFCGRQDGLGFDGFVASRKNGTFLAIRQGIECFGNPMFQREILEIVFDLVHRDPNHHTA